MNADRLIHSVGEHADQLADAAIRRIRLEKDLPHLQKLSDLDLRNWAHGILEDLQAEALAAADKRSAAGYRNLGRLRFEASVNLYEVVRCLHLLKLSIIEFVRNRGFAQNSIEVYAQEEFEHHIGLFFDWVLYNVVRGYEEASMMSDAARKLQPAVRPQKGRGLWHHGA